MYIFFADDSTRKRESVRLSNMGTLVGVGGVFIEDRKIKILNDKINSICVTYQFPANEPFKWSPGRELWMWNNLVDEKRKNFFMEIIDAAKSQGVGAIVAIEDISRQKATNAATPQIDVTRLFFERVEWKLTKLNSEGILIVDRPGGGRKEEDMFLYECLETLKQGTDYLNMEHIVLHACCPSKFARLLQLSDVIISCSIAAASGGRVFAPPIFDKIKEILCKEAGRIGGVGFKMHPDLCYVNLYHWLLGDTHYARMNTGLGLPIETRPYSENPY